MTDSASRNLAPHGVSSQDETRLVTTENANEGAGQQLVAEVDDGGDAPLSDVRRSATLTDAELRAFLGRRDSQERIRIVVIGRLKGQAPAGLVDDLAQLANIAALTSKARPRSHATANGWLSTIAARTVVTHFRGQAAHHKWLAPD